MYRILDNLWLQYTLDGIPCQAAACSALSQPQLFYTFSDTDFQRLHPLVYRLLDVPSAPRHSPFLYRSGASIGIVVVPQLNPPVLLNPKRDIGIALRKGRSR